MNTTNIKKTLIAMILIILLLGSLSGCIKEPETIKIGVIGVMTGFGAYYGNQELKGLELAKEEINSAGGINGKKIELVIEDSAASPNKAVSAIKKLISIDKVKYVIGDSWVSTTAAIVPITNNNKVILISPLALLDELSEDDYFFRTIPNTKDFMKPLAEYAYKNMGARKVGIIQQQTSYGVEHTRDFTHYFEKLGGKVVGVEPVQITQKDVQTELLKLKSKNPDTILNLHASSATLGMVMKKAKELGIETKWIASFGAENAPLIKEYSDSAEGLVYPYPYNPNSNKLGAKKFVIDYLKKHGEMPDMSSANSYDCLKLLAEAIEKGDSPETVKKHLLTIKDYQGGSGTISFDKNGDAKKQIFLKTIKDGKFVKIS